MWRADSCWLDPIFDRGGSSCVAWCSVTNLVAISARRRDLGSLSIILIEPSSPSENFELRMPESGVNQPLMEPLCSRHTGPGQDNHPFVLHSPTSPSSLPSMHLHVIQC